MSSTVPLNEALVRPLFDPRVFASRKGDPSELARLAEMTVLLEAIQGLLSAGKAEGLPELCREAASLAREMTMLYSPSPLAASLAEDAERRKALLIEIRRQHQLCAALLRRGRRWLALRRQVHALSGEPVTYTPALVPQGEPK